MYKKICLIVLSLSIVFCGFSINKQEFSYEYEIVLNSNDNRDVIKGYIYKDQKSYCVNIADENDSTYGNRLIQECVEEEIINDDDFATIIDENGNEQVDYSNCLIDKNDLIEQYAVYLYQQNIKQPLEYMLSIYTAKELLEYFPNCIDLKRLIKYVIDVDGRGHCISSYDGKEIKHNDYFIYRTN